MEEEETTTQGAPETQTPSPNASGAQTPIEGSSIQTLSMATSRTKAAPVIHPSLQEPSSLPHPLFDIEQLGIDRRLIVNRKRQIKMYRVWMQGKFCKHDK
jgi:tRNAThr (cytosine32-N3)-methyltransferase